jgi:hypothetical protein
MSRSRIAAIGLVVIAILFIVIQGVGVFGEGSSGNAQAKSQAEQGEYSPPNWIENIAGVLAPLAPKVELNVNQFLVPANTAQAIAIPPSPRSIRIASFELNTGEKAVLRYQNNGDNPLTDGQAERPLELPRASGKRRYRGSIIAGKEGGTLQIECQGSVSCQVSLR